MAAAASVTGPSRIDPDHHPAASRPDLKALHVESQVRVLTMAHQRHPESLVLGTRRSLLALKQTELVQATLERRFPSRAEHFSVVPMSTQGDKNQSQALYLMNGKSFWTQELEAALLEGGIDLIVHSLKDMPTSLPEGCELAAILEREDPTDCLVVKEGLSYKRLEDLPDGSVVGTSSVRRVAQLRRKFPKLVFVDVRGNIHTRLRKLDDPEGPFVAIILASAGLRRMDMQDRITCTIGAPSMLYAVGQGALGIEIRSGDERVKEMVNTLDHWQTGWTTRAERSLLRALEGGCSVPVGAQTTIHEERQNEQGQKSMHLTLQSCIASLAGDKHVESSRTRWVESSEDCEQLGLDVASELVQQGGKAILASLGRKVDSEEFKERHQKAVQGVVDRAAKKGQVTPSADPEAANKPHCGWMTPADGPGTPAATD